MDKQIFEKFDNNLLKNKKKLIEFAKSKGYEFYAEYIHFEYKTKTAQQVRNEMKDWGIIKPPSKDLIWKINSNINIALTPDIWENEKKSNAKMCRRCKKYPIADGNFLFCTKCHNDNKNKPSLEITY